MSRRRRLQEFLTKGRPEKADRALQDIHEGFRDLEKTIDEGVAEIAGGGVPTGCITVYTNGVTPPDGWLFCTGQAVDRTVYANLYALIGTTFGAGDGVTTFNLPDLRNRVVRHDAAQAIGATGGSETHVHTTGAPTSTGDVESGSGVSVAPGNHNHGNTGSGGAWLPFLVLRYIIKT